MTRLSGALKTLALLAILLAACGPATSAPAGTAAVAASAAPSASSPTPAPKPDNVVVAWVPIINFAPLFVAVEKGYLTEQRISVDLNVSQGGAEITGLLGNGTVDASFSGISAGTFAAIARGVDIKLVLPLSEHPAKGKGFASAFMIRKAVYDAGARSTKELRGKKIALNAPGGLAEYLYSKVLGSYGMTLKDIDPVYMGFGEMAVALKNGAIDAAFMGDPFATDVKTSGTAVPVEEDSAPTPGLQSSLLFYGPKFINERNDVAKRFSLAITKATREVAGDGLLKPDNLQIVSKYVKLSPDVIKTMITTTLFSTNPALVPTALTDEQDYFIKAGTLKIDKPIAPEKIIDNQFSEYVARQLGPYVAPTK